MRREAEDRRPSGLTSPTLLKTGGRRDQGGNPWLTERTKLGSVHGVKTSLTSICFLLINIFIVENRSVHTFSDAEKNAVQYYMSAVIINGALIQSPLY